MVGIQKNMRYKRFSILLFVRFIRQLFKCRYNIIHIIEIDELIMKTYNSKTKVTKFLLHITQQ